MKKQLICYLGRFQPWHKGHQHVLAMALAKAEYVLILCGSCNVAPNKRNPWSFEQRVSLIQQSQKPEDLAKIKFMPVCDMLYNDHEWCLQISKKIKLAKQEFNLPDDAEVSWIGHHKDKSSYYLDILPGSDYIEVPNFKSISSTDIRLAVKQNNLIDCSKQITPEVLKFLKLETLPSYSSQPNTMCHICLMHEGSVMFLKQSEHYCLPGFSVKQDKDFKGQAKLYNAYLSSWYELIDIDPSQIIEFKHKHRSDSGRQVAKVLPVHVKHKAKEMGVIWLDKYQMQDKIFQQDHASIAFNILNKQKV